MSKHRGDQTAQQTLNYIEKILTVEVQEDEYQIRLEEAISLSYSFLLQKKVDWTIDLENLAKRFIDLAFESEKHWCIKDVLKSYRSITQNQHPESLRGVLEYYRDKKLQQILDEEISPSQLSMIRNMPDIETDEASSDIILSSFEPENKNQTGEIKNKLKIVWDGYKAIIDTVRVNQKLQIVYRNTLTKVFQFADHYNRKHEFKSMCKYLKEGLKIAINKRDRVEQQKGFYIDIEKDEVNMNNIEIRLDQFKVTIKLGLWQEAFQVLEDINELMKVRKGTVKNNIKSIYFENLSLLFKKSNYWHYHAYAYFSYYITYLNKPRITSEEKTKIADKLLLSVLCIPPSTLERNQSKESRDKICSIMISSTKIPDKKELEELMISRGVVENASDSIKELWYFMFLEFDMTSLERGLSLLKNIDQENQQFINLIENILIYKQLISIAEVYQRIKYDHLLALTPLPKQKIKKILLECYHQKIIDFILDEKEGIVIFQDKSEEVNPHEELHETYIDLALCREDLRKMDKNFIIEKTMNFMDAADEHYWKIREYKIDQYKKKLKAPKQQLANMKRKQEREKRAKIAEEERIRKQREEQERKKEEERKGLFIKKKVIIEDIIKIKEQRIVRASTGVGKKKIQELTNEEIDEMPLATFQMLLEETKTKVLSDTENRFKKKFLGIHYYERERRELLSNVMKEEIERNGKQKKERIIQVSKQNFDENQKLKARIQEVAPEVKDKIEEHYNRAYNNYEENLEKYKTVLSDLYKIRIIHKAKQLRQLEKKKKIQEEQRLKEAQMVSASEMWTFRSMPRVAQSEKNDTWFKKPIEPKTEEKKQQKKEEKKTFNLTIGSKNRFNQLEQVDDDDEKKAKKEDEGKGKKEDEGKWNMKKKGDEDEKKKTEDKWIKKTEEKEPEKKNTSGDSGWMGKKIDPPKVAKFVPPPPTEKKEEAKKTEEPKKKGKMW